MVNAVLAAVFVFLLGYTAGVVVTRVAAQYREERRARRLTRRSTATGHLRAPRAPQAVRREVAHG